MIKVKLGDIVIFGNGATIPKEKGKIPAFGGNGITNYVNSFNVNDKTIIIGRVGAYCGSVHYYEGKSWITDNALYIKVNSDIDAKFLSQYLKLTNLNKIQIGSSQPLITQGILSNLEIYIPPRPTQTAIANILSTLDDKIELNNKINNELENLAKTIYEYWFVQNEDKKWELKKLSDLLVKDVKKIKSISSKNILLDGKYPVIKQDTDSFINGYTNEINPINRLPVIIFGDHSCTLKYINFPFFQGADGTQLLYFNKENLTNYVYFCLDNLMHNLPNYKKYERHFKYLKEFKICIPNDKILNQFNKTIFPIFEQIYNNIKENTSLSHLRDYLLPLLMNGQIVVSDVQAIVSESIKVTETKTPKTDRKELALQRMNLSACILDNICDEPTTGRVKFEKSLYLCEHEAQIHIDSEYLRATAGPYDSKTLYGIEDKLAKAKWYQKKKITDNNRTRYIYIRLEKSQDYKKYIDKYLTHNQKSIIDRLIKILKPLKTEQCEIIATLYGAWNDFLIEGIQPTDKQIVDEVTINWDESKQRIENERWFNALIWMRQNGIVPTGFGLSTKKHE